MTISFNTLTNGTANDARPVNSNFTKVNVELFTTKLAPESSLQNPYADVIIGPFTVGTLGASSNHFDIRISPPVMDDVLIPVRASLSFNSGGANADATLDIVEVVGGTSGSIFTSVLTATTAVTVFTRDSFSDVSIAANSVLRFEISESTGNAAISGITAMLWCKTRHQG